MEEDKHPMREFLVTKAVGVNKSLLPYHAYEADDMPVVLRSLRTLLIGFVVSLALIGPMKIITFLPLTGLVGNVLLAIACRYLGDFSGNLKKAGALAIPVAIYFAAYTLVDIFYSDIFYGLWFAPIVDYVAYLVGVFLLLLLCRGLPEVVPCKKEEVTLLLPLYVAQCLLVSLWGGIVCTVIVFALGIASGLILLRAYRAGEENFGIEE